MTSICSGCFLRISSISMLNCINLCISGCILDTSWATYMYFKPTLRWSQFQEVADRLYSTRQHLLKAFSLLLQPYMQISYLIDTSFQRKEYSFQGIKHSAYIAIFKIKTRLPGRQTNHSAFHYIQATLKMPTAIRRTTVKPIYNDHIISKCNFPWIFHKIIQFTLFPVALNYLASSILS